MQQLTVEDPFINKKEKIRTVLIGSSKKQVASCLIFMLF